MENRRIIGLGVSSMTIFLVSVILFFILKPDYCNVSVVLGFCFLLFSYIALFGGLIGLEYIKNNSQIIARVGCGITVTVYFCLSAVSSLIYMIMNTESVKFFCVLQIGFITMAVIASVIFFMAAGSVKKNDDKVLTAIARVSDMADRLLVLSGNKKYGNQMKKLAADLSYTDSSAGAGVDDEIEEAISNMEMKLEEDEYSDQIAESINRLTFLINKRKIQVRSKKVGGI